MGDIIKPDKLSAVLSEGDLESLGPKGRNEYYVRLCSELELNPLTQPFRYIPLQGRLKLYVTKGGAEQLRDLRGISITSIEEREFNGLLVTKVTAKDKSGRVDVDTGFAVVKGLQGDALGNAILKSYTKGKRRVTLSMCGLGGLMDESEMETVKRQANEEFSPGDGEGFVEAEFDDEPKFASGQMEEVATMSYQLDQLGTLSSLSHWVYSRGPRIMELPGELRTELLREVARKSQSWGVTKDDIVNWVKRREISCYGQRDHMVPSQLREGDTDVF